MRISVGCSLILVAACGGGAGPTGSGGNPPPGAQIVNVSMTDNGVSTFVFSPASPPPIKVGTIVRWTNNGTVTHTTTSDAGVTPAWSSGDLAAPTPGGGYGGGGTPGGSYSVTFTQPGSYSYHCAYHAAQGMTGTITVTP